MVFGGDIGEGIHYSYSIIYNSHIGNNRRRIDDSLTCGIDGNNR